MFKIRVKLALTLALGSFVSFSAQAIDLGVDLDGVYVGGGNQSSNADLQYEDWLLSDGDEYGDGIGFNLFAGYRMTENIAIELEGRYWGIGTDLTPDHEGDLRGNISTGLKFSVPIADSIDLTASFGLTHWFIKDFDSDEGLDSGVIGLKSFLGEEIETHDSSAFYGLGISTYLNDAIELGLRYDMHSAFVTNVESLNLYAAYHFGDLRRSAPHDIFSRLYVSFNAAQFSRGGYSENIGLGQLLPVQSDVGLYLLTIPSYQGDLGYDTGDDTDGYYFFVGYQMNPWVSLEIGAMDFGTYELSIGSIRDDRGVEFVINEKLIDADMTGTLFGLKANAYRSEYGFNIYTRFGVNHVEAEIVRNYLTLEFDEGIRSSFVSPYYGAGISYQVLDSLSVSLDYIVFELDDAVINARSRSIGLGVTYTFGSESRRANNVRESSIFTDYFTGDDDPADNSLERTTACGERYRGMFFGCEDGADQESPDN